MKKILKYITIFYKGALGIFIEIFFILLIIIFSLILNFLFYSLVKIR